MQGDDGPRDAEQEIALAVVLEAAVAARVHGRTLARRPGLSRDDQGEGGGDLARGATSRAPACTTSKRSSRRCPARRRRASAARPRGRARGQRSRGGLGGATREVRHRSGARPGTDRRRSPPSAHTVESPVHDRLPDRGEVGARARRTFRQPGRPRRAGPKAGARRRSVDRMVRCGRRRRRRGRLGAVARVGRGLAHAPLKSTRRSNLHDGAKHRTSCGCAPCDRQENWTAGNCSGRTCSDGRPRPSRRGPRRAPTRAPRSRSSASRKQSASAFTNAPIHELKPKGTREDLAGHDEQDDVRQRLDARRPRLVRDDGRLAEHVSRPITRSSTSAPSATRYAEQRPSRITYAALPGSPSVTMTVPGGQRGTRQIPRAALEGLDFAFELDHRRVPRGRDRKTARAERCARAPAARGLPARGAREAQSGGAACASRSRGRSRASAAGCPSGSDRAWRRARRRRCARRDPRGGP